MEIMVTPKNGHVKTPRCNPDKGLLGEINDQGYEVVGAMTAQSADLSEICDTNGLEDEARARCASTLREQEKELLRLGRPAGFALELNRRAQRWLVRADILDAEQGLDRRAPVTRATKRNREAHAAGRRVIQLTEAAPAAICA